MTQPTSTRHGSLEKHRSAPESNLPDMLKYIFLLQEKIVDSMPLTESTSNPESNRAKPAPSPVAQTSVQSLISRPTLEIGTQLEEKSNMRTPLTSGTNGLKEVGVKLNELRQQRKQIFDDDDIWNEIENLKL